MEEEIISKFLPINDTNSSPTCGKYSAQKETFFEDIRRWQEGKIKKEEDIIPLQFTFEITNKCNCNCKDCGMAANSIKIGKTKMSEDEVLNIVDSLYECGIPAFAITGGDHF